MSQDPQPIDLTVEWTQVPLLASLIGHPQAFHRCSVLNPELKALRQQAVKLVRDGIDAVLLPAGYTRTSLTWSKGEVWTPAPTRPPTIMPATGGLLSRMLGRSRDAPRAPYISSWGNDGAVRLSLQKDRYGSGIYVNIEVRNAGRHDPQGAAIGEGTRTYRSQSFIRDLPRNYIVDQYAYVRLVEDRRYLDFLLNLIEDRILPFMQAYADTATEVTRLPLATEVPAGRPLRLPEQERWRMFDFEPTQQMYQAYAAAANFFSFALRDGRAFQGAITDVAPGRFRLSWNPDPLPGGSRVDAGPVPPDEWVPFSQIDPGSLSYRTDTGNTIMVDLTLDPHPGPHRHTAPDQGPGEVGASG